MIGNEKEIKFYSQIGEYGFFSNFYKAPFMVDKKLYQTTEHYFQSKKFEGHPQEKLIIDAGTPAKAFQLGRTR